MVPRVGRQVGGLGTGDVDDGRFPVRDGKDVIIRTDNQTAKPTGRSG